MSRVLRKSTIFINIDDKKDAKRASSEWNKSFILGRKIAFFPMYRMIRSIFSIPNVKQTSKTLSTFISYVQGDKTTNRQNYKIHGQQGDKVYGGTKSGFLQKRSEG